MTEAEGRDRLVRLSTRALLLALLVPLAAGLVTVTYRDASSTHFPGKIVTARLLASGEFPFVHPGLSSGQPLAGNPNFATFLPDTLLHLVLPPATAFGLHFALALLLGAVGARRWARAHGAGRAEAEVAGIAFAVSGLFLSAWLFYNTGMALALAPWLAAAAVRTARRAARGDRPGVRRGVAEIALTGALDVVAGEPVVALLAVVTATVAAAGGAIDGRRAAGSGGVRLVPAMAPVAAGLLLAGLLAAPQILLAAQITPFSTRGSAPFRPSEILAASTTPGQLLTLAVPFPDGRPDRTGAGRWDGIDSTDGGAPYLWTLHLGWPLLLLLARHGRLSSASERILAAFAAVAFVLSLGRFLPGAELLAPVVSLGGRIRFPVKAWYALALALVPLSAFAAARLRRGEAGRFAPAVALLAALLVGTGSVLAHRRLLPLDLAGLALSLLASTSLLFLDRRPAFRPLLPPLVAATGLLAAAPIFLLVLDRPPRLVPVPDGGRLHERAMKFIHPFPGTPPPPERSVRETSRRAWSEWWGTSGAAAGGRYAFDLDPDGSYSIADRDMRARIDALPWSERAVELRVAGVDRVIASEPLPPPFRPVGLLYRPFDVRLYELSGSAPEVRVATRSFEADDPDDVMRVHRRPDFRLETDAVVSGSGGGEPRGEAAPARLRVRTLGASRLEAEAETERGGTLVWNRSWWPAWKGSVNGADAPVLLAHGHLVAIPLPAGRSVVRIEWDRRPLQLGIALAAIAATVALALRVTGRPARVSLDAPRVTM